MTGRRDSHGPCLNSSLNMNITFFVDKSDFNLEINVFRMILEEEIMVFSEFYNFQFYNSGDKEDKAC